MYSRQFKQIRLAINALMIAALLAGLIPPPLATHLAQTAASEPLVKLAEAATDSVDVLHPKPDVALATGLINGTVFRDFNSNGTLDVGEPGIGTIDVTVFDAGRNTCTTSTSATGTYNINTGSCGSLTAGPYRVEFTLPTDGSLDFLQPSPAGTTTVQFVADGGSTVNAGFHYPGDYCQSNPDLAASCYISGDPSGGAAGSSDVLVSFAYNSSGTSPPPNHLANGNELGATWGLAYHRTENQLYTGAFLKRHVGLLGGRTGAIYRTDVAAQTSSLFIDLNSVTGINTGAEPTVRDLSTNPANPSYDNDAFGLVGKIGLGDLEISDDQTTLYAINLNDRQLVTIDIRDGATVNPDPATDISFVSTPDPGCSNGFARPFALKYHQGLLYVGVTCTAESGGTATDLSAHVYSYDGTTFSANPIFSISDMTYTKGRIDSNSVPADVCTTWRPWTSDWADVSFTNSDEPEDVCNPQPILSDIEFDTDGSMILAFIDRHGHQAGYLNHVVDPTESNGAALISILSGEILRVALDNGTYTLENAGTTANGGGLGASGYGPGGGSYYDDNVTHGFGSHFEAAIGSLALLPSSGQVAMTIMDPKLDPLNGGISSNLYSGGIAWLDNTSGAAQRGYQLYDINVSGSFGKASGLGDLELLCQPVPLEIGNRVWWDANDNGVQDADEAAIPDVQLELWLVDANVTLNDENPLDTVNDATLAATTITDSQGRYYFSYEGDPLKDDANGYADQDWQNSETGLRPNRTYQVRIPNYDTGGSANETAIRAANGGIDFELSDKDQGGATNGEIRDSNAYDNPGNAAAVVNTGGPGQNDHTLDFGFASLAAVEVSIGNQVWVDGNDNGIFEVGEDIVPNLLMELWVDVDDDGIAEPLGHDGLTAILTTTTSASGQYSFTNLMEGNYFVRIPAPPVETPLSSIPLSEPDNGVDNDDNGDQPAGPNTQILSPVVNLTAGEEPGTTGGGNSDHTVDFGLVDPFIGNLVWHDQNNNGLVDTGEPGIAGVTVTVLYDGDASGGFTGSELTPYRTTQTDSNGLYVFPDLIPNANYQVVIPIENFQAGGALENLPYSTDPTVAADNQIDEDDNGIQSSVGMTVTSVLIRIDVDGEPIDGTGTNDESGRGNTLDNGDDNNGDMTIDFGFTSVEPQQPVSLEIVKIVRGGSVTAPFNVTVTGPNGYNNTVAVVPGTPTELTNLALGTYTVVEESPISTGAPAGFAWFAPSYEPAGGRVSISSGMTGTITVTNYLGEIPTGSTGVLTVTKMVDWGSNTPDAGQQFAYSIDGPAGFTTINDTIVDGGTMTYSVPAGIYTVTETSPGTGWVTTYTVSSTVSSTSGVVDLSSVSVTSVAPAAISGTVFRDFNSDGELTANGSITEIGLAGVTVTAYGPDGNAVGNTTSGSDGTYSLTPSTNGPWRIEFTDLPAGYEPSFMGSDNSSIQLVTTSGATGIDFAANRPADYCQSNPSLATVCYINGDSSGNEDVLVSFAYDNSGTAPAPTHEAVASQIGSTWGVAYQRSTEQLYTSAFVKRHVGLNEEPAGTPLPGAIYRLSADGNDANDTTPLWLNLEGTIDSAGNPIDVGAVPDSGTRGLGAVGDPSNDPDVFSQIGSVGLGDIDIADDESALWVTNLQQQALHRVAINADGSAGTVDTFAIPTAQCNTNASLFIDSGATDGALDSWSGDGYYLSGNPFTTPSGVNTTPAGVDAAPAFVYQTVRGGSSLIQYRIPVPSGDYDLKLHFAELGFNANGQRIFDVNIEGNTELNDYDIHAAAGGQFIAQVETISVTVNDGLLEIDLMASVSVASLAGLEIVPTSGQSFNDARPFAVKTDNDDVYIGVVCTAEYTQNTADLHAHIYRLNSGAAPFVPVFDFALDYPKGPADEQGVAPPNCNAITGWFPWTTVMQPVCNTTTNTAVYPQPILSDIEFDVDGSMMLGFMDRFGHQAGHGNYGLTGTTPFSSVIGGDILRVCNVNGSYVLEGGAGCANNAANNQGPGGGEYYQGDRYFNTDDTYVPHAETSLGGLVFLPGSGEVALTSMDPLDGTSAQFSSGGVTFLNNNSGAKDDSYRLYAIGDTGTFGKAAGLGDLEIMCLAAPLEIGNRVWDDYDGNGVQDAGEPGLNGVQVTLEQAGQAPQQVNTSGDGNYVFTVEPHTPYTITVATPAGYSLTTPNAEAVSGSTTSNDAILDVRDSDALLVNGTPTILYTSGSAGQNNHGLDFGFAQPASGQVDIENRVPEDLSSIAIVKMLNTPPTVTVGAQISFTIRITNTGGVTITTLPLTDTYDATYLAFNTIADATGPNPATTVNANSVYWADATTYDGNGGELIPGETLDIIVVFDTVADTTGAAGGSADCSEGVGNTYNKATAMGMDACAEVPITPTEPKLTLGDYIWHDIDNNGTQDANEPGIDGVLVYLWELDGSNNPILTSLITTTTTTTNTGGGPVSGFYQFNVPSGKSYRVEVASSNFDPGGPLEGFVLGANQGTINNDADPDQTANNVTVNDDTLDFGFYCAFDLALDKKLALGQPATIAPGDNVTFTITVYNQGVVTATSITIADYVPTGFIVAGGGWTGTSGTVNQTLAATLTPSGTVSDSLTIDIVLTAGAALSGTYTNVAEIITYTTSIVDGNGSPLPDSDSTPDSTDGNGTGESTDLVDDEITEDGTNGGDEDDHDPASVTVVAAVPTIAVDKQFNGQGDYRVGETISFTIRITNTGDAVIDTLPLEDRYSSAFITYVSANPAPSSVAGGLLTWTDVLSSTNDLDGLGLGESVGVVVTFTTEADTTLLPAIAPCTQAGHAPNVARSVGATAGTQVVVEDADDSSCDSVQILNPTAVQIAVGSMSQTADGVLVAWTTESENNIAGFYIWKASGVVAEVRSSEMILATNTGQSTGASYQWLDAGATLNRGDVYILDIVKRNGTIERVILGVMNIVDLFLPVAK
ncbi:MAG: SdrD B-like domain-containing protein [Chloroflexota bacterium]